MRVQTISQMKANAANLPDELGFSPLFVTQNGKSSLVVQTHEAYQHQQEKMAFMTLLLQSRKDIEQGRTAPARDFLSSI